MYKRQFIPGLFKAHVESLRIGVQKNIEKPGPFAAENTKEGETGRFFDDYCNWQRIDEFRNAAFDKNVAKTAALLMQSKTVQMFHDHVLVKEAGTLTSTPWHTDGPYYFVKGIKTLSFWVPLDPVKDATLRMVAGSHKWQSLYFQLNGCRMKISTRLRMSIYLFQIPRKNIWISKNSTWNPEMLLHLISIFCMALVEQQQINEDAHSP